VTEEERLREELTEVRRLLSVDRAATDPSLRRWGPVKWGICTFLLFVTMSGCARWMGWFWWW
jgi:hypothetical protein